MPKLVRAAARTHRATGLPIYSHTGNGIAALAQVAVLEDERVPLGAFVWVHAQNETDSAVHAQVARRGAWVSFDGVSAHEPRASSRLRAGDARGPRCSIASCVSHDAGWYHVGEPDGGTYRPHDLIFTEFLPALRARGLTAREITQVMVENPRRVLTDAVGAQRAPCSRRASQPRPGGARTARALLVCRVSPSPHICRLDPLSGRPIH